MRLRFRILALLLPFLAACTDAGTVARDPAGGPATQEPVTLTVHRHWQPGKDGGVFIEGSVTSYSLVDASGERHQPTRQTDDTVVWAGLDPGQYTLGSAEQPCDGNCGVLDPPVDSCEADLTLDHDTQVGLKIVVGRPCEIS